MSEIAANRKPTITSRSRRMSGDQVFDLFNIAFMIVLVCFTLYPFVNVLAVSLNSPADSLKGGIYLWPREWSIANYQYILKNPAIYHATMISVLRTVLGTAITVFCSAMVAYTISREEYVLRKFVTVAFILTMYLSGGLIPTFLVMRELGLYGSFWIYILPGVIGVFNLIIIRSFIYGLPDGILESARIDGAGEYRTFFNIVLPLCTPVLATIALFTAVGQWNSWFDVFIYNSQKANLSTLQYELQRILSTSSAANSGMNAASAFARSGDTSANMVTPLSIRSTMTIVASVPIICVYPFLQKYFVKGMMVGGVKG